MERVIYIISRDTPIILTKELTGKGLYDQVEVLSQLGYGLLISGESGAGDESNYL